ncbi:MAG: hypothetical protein Rubg2KO_15300 [Rubricoccaceae bacterium]
MSTAFTVADLFCGCGGSSTGAAAVEGVEVRLAVNHWERAVESHAANHPDADTALCDLHEVHPAAFDSMTALLASPECTTHSPARGSKRRNLQQLDAFEACHIAPETLKSRATMWTVTHWASVHRPAFVIVENVVEIHYWPEFTAWLTEMRNLGYDHERVYVNGMHIHGLTDERVQFSMPQSRDRIYVVFWRRGNPKPDLAIRPLAPCPSCVANVRGVQSWKDTKLGRQRWGRYRRQYVYTCPDCFEVVEPYTFAAANAIDWSIPSTRIGDRKRPLSEKTIARIRYGLERYGLRPYAVANRYSSGVECRVNGVDVPLPTLPSQEVVGLVETAYSHSGDNRVQPLSDPMPTQSTRNTQALVYANRTHSTLRGSDEPMHTVATGGHLALLTPFAVDLANASRQERSATPMDGPLPTLTTAYTRGLVTTHRGQSKSHPSDAPLTSVTAHAINHGLVTSPAAQLTLRGGRSLDGLDDPLGTVVASAQQIGVLSRHPFLVQYYGSLNASSTDEPLPVVTTQDRHGLATPPDGEGDVDIDDLCFRMLEPHELKVGTGHPEDYVLAGTKRDRVRLVGNSNYPGIEQLLVQRCMDTLSP